jgi:5-methyltetrahydrofolate--homocysteine methyltransferase
MGANNLIDELTAGGSVLLDGAWGTELQARGLEGGEVADLWNLRHPERVEDVARAYVEAGSQVILTNTFRANRIALQRYGAENHVVEINRAGAQISGRAAAGRAKVFASIGPSGKMLMTREVDEAALAAAFAEQAQALAEGGADALVLETMVDLAEARIALVAALTTGLPVVACMVFDSGKNRDRTMMGVSPAQAAAELARAGAHVVGANCGVGIDHAVALCRAMAGSTDRPVWIKPNAGIPELVHGEIVYRTDAETFASFVPELLAAGAKFIGGCCGSTPDFVAAIRRRLGR